MDEFMTHDLASLLWLILLGILVWQAWFSSKAVAGLGLCHWASQAINHFIGEFFVSRNEGFISPDRMAAEMGFRLSGWAILGLLTAFAGNWLVERAYGGNQERIGNESSSGDSSTGIRAIIYGMVCYFFICRTFSFIPSLTSILSGGLFMAAIGLAWVYLIQLKRRGSTAGLITVSLALTFPAFTLILEGFMGFGIAAIFSVAGVVAVTHRPRWVIGIVGPIVLFFGLSLYPAYMIARESIRAKVWGGGDISARMEATVNGIAENWVWFDPTDESQMALLNGRLNQNVLVGYAYDYIGSGSARFAEGETIVDGLYALIPRAVWTDKSIKAGGAGLATRFTGIKFADGTSVGIGNIMEMYCNFGILGIYFGFLLIGMCIYRLDILAGKSIRNLDYKLFFYCMVPGQSLMNSIGAFSEWGPSIVGSVILVWMFVALNEGITKKMRSR